MKSKSTSKIMSSVRERVMEFAPNEYSAYIKCSESKCGKERAAYNKSLEDSDEKIQACVIKSNDVLNVKKCSKNDKTMTKCLKDAKTMKKTMGDTIKQNIKQNMKKCIKDIIQGTKEYKTMRKCTMKNCGSERKKLRSSIKKYKSNLIKNIKSNVSKSNVSKSNVSKSNVSKSNVSKSNVSKKPSRK